MVGFSSVGISRLCREAAAERKGLPAVILGSWGPVKVGTLGSLCSAGRPDLRQFYCINDQGKFLPIFGRVDSTYGLPMESE